MHGACNCLRCSSNRVAACPPDICRASSPPAAKADTACHISLTLLRPQIERKIRGARNRLHPPQLARSDGIVALLDQDDLRRRPTQQRTLFSCSQEVSTLSTNTNRQPRRPNSLSSVRISQARLARAPDRLPFSASARRD